MGVEGEFASVGEVLEEVKAEEEDFFILYAEALGDAIEGVLRHVHPRVDDVQDQLVFLDRWLHVGVVGRLLD